MILLLGRLRQLPPTRSLGINKVLNFGLGLGMQESSTSNEKKYLPIFSSFKIHI